MSTASTRKTAAILREAGVPFAQPRSYEDAPEGFKLFRYIRKCPDGREFGAVVYCLSETDFNRLLAKWNRGSTGYSYRSYAVNLPK